jgi:hypothetical protein
MRSIARAVVLTALAWLAAAGALTLTGARATEVDLELVLAVDASGSVNGAEFQLQLGGIAAAFRDPAVQAAALSGPRQQVAVAVLVWSDAAFPKFPTNWFLIDSPGAAAHFADIAESFHSKVGRSRGIGGGGTAIGDAVAYAIAMINENGFQAPRRVVDVSGDGIETPPWFGDAYLLPQAKLLAARHNVLVNGLAITSDFPNLVDYYRQNVITGPGSFVIRAANFEDFRRAMREKLLRELTSAFVLGPAPLALPRISALND